MYCDDQLTNTIVENNLFENCYRAALFGGGVGNVFKNNTIVSCETGVQYDNRGASYQAGSAVPDSDDTSDNTYEEFVKFLGKSAVQETLEYRKSNFNGFKTLVSDVENYQKDSSYKMGYPKDAVITGNVHFGENAEADGYEAINNDVLIYGTVSNNQYFTNVGEYQIPDCGVKE